jgi:hypothetical protein
MTTPEIHVASLVYATLLSASAYLSEYYGLSGHAIPWIFATALYAVWRNDALTRKQMFFWMIGGVAVAIGFVSGLAGLIDFVFGFKPQMQFLACAMAFVFIDKPWRDKLFGWIAIKAESVEVKK